MGKFKAGGAYRGGAYKKSVQFLYLISILGVTWNMRILHIIVSLVMVESVHATDDTAEECIYVDFLGKKFDINAVGCPNNIICNANKTINIQYINFPPYYFPSMKEEEDDNDFQKPLHQLLRRCCGTCANIFTQPLR